MSCPDGSIRNPNTDRCVKIGGHVFKQLLKDKKIAFTVEDKKKIRDAGYKLDSPLPGPSKPLSPPKPPIGIDGPKVKPDAKTLEAIDIKDVKKAVVKKVEAHLSKLSVNDQYIDKGHLDYCKNGKDVGLTVPLEKTVISYHIPYSVCQIRNHYGFIPYLDADKLLYTKGFHKSIDVKFNNYNRAVSMLLFKNSEYKIDYDWFKEMDDYVRSLSTYDAFTVLGYSYHSFDFINKFLIGQMNSINHLLTTTAVYDQYFFPFYMQAFMLLDSIDLAANNPNVIYNNKSKKLSEWCNDVTKLGLKGGYKMFKSIMSNFPFEFWKLVMQLYRDDLKRIIDNAPPVKKEMVVYRGVKDDYFLKGAKNNYYHNKCFVSCTLSPSHALLYLRGNQCCFKRITLLPGTKVLFISGLSCYPDELEIVINVDSTLYIKETFKRRVYDSSYKNDNGASKDDICFNLAKRNVDISELVVVESTASK